MNKIKRNKILALYLIIVKSHPSVELLRLKWEENYPFSHGVASGQKMAVSFCNYLQGGVRNNRQSNNKIIMNGDVKLMMFPPFGTEE